MIYRIADFVFDIESGSKPFEEFCKEYVCHDAEKIDCKIVITKEDLDKEIEYTKQSGQTLKNLKPYNMVVIAVYRKICAYVLEHNAFLMHCAVIKYKDKGYAFTAQSGTGKTTHIMLWKEKFGEENVTIINGDKPILRYIDGKFYAYGTPWNGKEGYGVNDRVELKGISFVHRAKENSVERISIETAVPLLFSQIMVSDSTDLVAQLELVDLLVEKVPMYKLNCKMSVEAAEVAYKAMSEGEK